MKNENLPIEDATYTEETGNDNFNKTPGKFGVYVRKHKMVFFLLVLLVLISLTAVIKIMIMENQYTRHTAALVTDYENKIDSLMAQQLVLTSKVFSWAIRSELTHDNNEQVNQFFMSFIQEKGVTNIKLVDVNTSTVKLSTDKKDEGSIVNNPAIMTDKPIYQTNDSTLQVISPVMGLNNKIGVLIIEYKRE
jgi:L-lactate utilization protein LutC